MSLAAELAQLDAVEMEASRLATLRERTRVSPAILELPSGTRLGAREAFRSRNLQR